MREFRDKVAVITGAASGIGRALADRCVQEGMRVVLADIEEQALAEAASGLEADGARVLAVPTDVSLIGDIRALAQKTLDAFGSVHLLFNNAGVVGVPGSVWENSHADWRWVIGVNLWGVIHGVRVFVPIMLDQGFECHIVNTASVAGLISDSGLGIYKVTKHGVVTLSETLYHELAETQAKVKVSVLCPGFVSTRLTDSDRNRPPGLKSDPTKPSISSDNEASWHGFLLGIQAGTPAAQIADFVFRAIREERFYILPHPKWKDRVRTRMEDILEERNPMIE